MRKTSAAIATHRLLLSFWDICFDNLPVGTFTHRQLTAKEARELIHRAKKAGALLCLSSDDLTLQRYASHLRTGNVAVIPRGRALFQCLVVAGRQHRAGPAGEGLWGSVAASHSPPRIYE
jgi:hypothetical protein